MCISVCWFVCKHKQQWLILVRQAIGLQLYMLKYAKFFPSEETFHSIIMSKMMICIYKNETVKHCDWIYVLSSVVP